MLCVVSNNNTNLLASLLPRIHKMSENIIMNRYFDALIQDREDEAEYVDVDRNFSPADTIRIEFGSRYYVVEYNHALGSYVIVTTNNPVIRQSQ